jgi:hypothetical protein
MSEENRATLSVARNAAGRWEWVLSFDDDVSLASKRVSDEDYATQQEAVAAGEAARNQFVTRNA